MVKPKNKWTQNALPPLARFCGVLDPRRMPHAHSALIHAMCIPNLASANVHLILEPTIVLGCQLAIGG